MSVELEFLWCTRIPLSPLKIKKPDYCLAFLLLVV